MADEKFTIELTEVEARWLALGAEKLGDEFSRSFSVVNATPELREAWRANAQLMRALSARLRSLKSDHA